MMNTIQKKRWFRFSIGLVVSTFFLYIAFNNIDWHQLKDNFFLADPLIWLGAIASAITTHIFRAIRWGTLLKPILPVSLHLRFSSVMIGNFANNILPLRLGEFARAYALSLKTKIPTATALVSIVLERLLDILSVVFILIGVVFFSDRHSWLGKTTWIFFAIGMTGLVILALAFRYRNALKAFAIKSSDRQSSAMRTLFVKGFNLFEKSADGAASLADKKSFFPLIFTTLLIVASGYFSNALPLIPFMESANIWAPGWITFGLVTVALAIPSAPANIGPVQYACLIALTPYGLSREQALAYSLIYQGSQFIPLTLIGLIYFLMYSIRFDDLKKIESDDPKKNKVREN